MYIYESIITTKVSHILSIGEPQVQKFYTIFRTLIYDRQKKLLDDFYSEKPQNARQRKFFNKEVYLYFYEGQVFISKNLLKSKNDKPLTAKDKADFTTIYCYISRSLTHNQNVHNLEYKIAEILWRRNKDYNKAVAQGGFINFYHYPINNPYKNNINEYIKLDLLNQKPAGKIHPKSMPNIIKLHGSINWQLTDFSSLGILQYEEDYNESMLSPFIIPPILDKTKLYENLTFKKCWNQAYESLKNARKIFIYGFSFPQTDLAIKFLFQSALRHNHKFKIYVINTKDMVDENSQYYAKDRYQNIFARYDIDFKYCCDNSLNLFNGEIYKL